MWISIFKIQKYCKSTKINWLKIYNKVRLSRNHGLINRDVVKRFGYVSRMDSLQAGILSFRIENLKKVILKRRRNAELYSSLLNRENIFIPIEDKKDGGYD